MQFSSILLALPFLGLVLAAPASAPLEVEVVNGTESVLEKRIANTYCTYVMSPGRIPQFTIGMAGWGNNDETSRSGCGTGLLDNIRGQCGGSSSVNGWGCDAVRENPHDTRVHWSFNTWSIATIPGCVNQAIWLASPSYKKEYDIRCTCVSGC